MSPILALGIAAALSQLVIEWYVNEFAEPQVSAMRIMAAFAVGLATGAILALSTPALGANAVALAYALETLSLRLIAIALAEEMSKIVVKGLSIGLIGVIVRILEKYCRAAYDKLTELFEAGSNRIEEGIQQINGE